VRDALDGLGQSASSRISVDARTNSLLVEAPPESLARIQDLVARLDVPQ
jgi:type II secretory pathway component GspD/PulD (secretin)